MLSLSNWALPCYAPAVGDSLCHSIVIVAVTPVGVGCSTLTYRLLLLLFLMSKRSPYIRLSRQYPRRQRAHIRSYFVGKCSHFQTRNISWYRTLLLETVQLEVAAVIRVDKELTAHGTRHTHLLVGLRVHAKVLVHRLRQLVGGQAVTLGVLQPTIRERNTTQ